MIKEPIVNLLGRERINYLTAPYYDWRERNRTRVLLSTISNKGLCLNLGCGHRPISGWVNLDISRGFADVVWDLRNGLPFTDQSCEVIFSEHVIEHLRRDDCLTMLKECYRVLQSGGVLRLSTPDAEKYLRSYAGDGEFLRHPAFGASPETLLDRINHMMREDGQHLWVYDYDSLKVMLQKSGFGQIDKTVCGSSIHPKLIDLDTKEREFESLYVEATKDN